MKKEQKKLIDNVGTCLVWVGIILLFLSIWSNGWTILRLFLTSLVLIIGGYGLWDKVKKND